MAYLEELLPEFRKGAKIRHKSWYDGMYVCMKDSKLVDDDGYSLKNICGNMIISDEWEFYKEPESDWDYIIKNKCLCYFWDYEEESKVTGILYNIEADSEFKFVRKIGRTKFVYTNCRPVRRDEVTFYEDRKDESI